MARRGPATSNRSPRHDSESWARALVRGGAPEPGSGRRVECATGELDRLPGRREQPVVDHRESKVEEPRFERVRAQSFDAGASRDPAGELGGRDPVVGALRGRLPGAQTPIQVRTPVERLPDSSRRERTRPVEAPGRRPSPSRPESRRPAVRLPGRAHVRGHDATCSERGVISACGQRPLMAARAELTSLPLVRRRATSWCQGGDAVPDGDPLGDDRVEGAVELGVNDLLELRPRVRQ